MAVEAWGAWKEAPVGNVDELLFPPLGVVILVIREVRMKLKYYRRGFASLTGAFNALGFFSPLSSKANCDLADGVEAVPQLDFG